MDSQKMRNHIILTKKKTHLETLAVRFSLNFLRNIFRTSVVLVSLTVVQKPLEFVHEVF